MKTKSKSQKEKEDPKKKQSSPIIDDILKDYNNVQKSDNDNNIFKWRTLEDTVLCKAYNEFKAGKKLLAFDLDDTLIESFIEKKKSEKAKSPNKKKKKKETILLFLI